MRLLRIGPAGVHRRLDLDQGAVRDRFDDDGELLRLQVELGRVQAAYD